MSKVSRRMLMALGGLILLAAPAMAQDTITVTFQGPVFIPDDDADTEIIMPVLVTQALRITNVDVVIDIDHPRMSDLRIRLVNPTGDDRLLADEGNCPNTRNLTNFTFDTGAAQRYGTFCPTAPGQSAQPLEEIDTWGDTNSSGLWDIRIEDREGGSVGFLLSYTLRITGTRVTAPTFSENTIFNAASYRRGPLSPGELVWLFGTSVGPTDPVTAQFDANGRLPTSLMGTSVTFDGVAAPINFASFNALQVQVPYVVAGRNTTAIQVTAQGLTSAVASAGLVAAAPGLYTVGGAGGGQLQAQNSDFSRNSAANAAARGSYVIVYANGLGATNPPVATGQRTPATPGSVATLPITASIGGQPAQVLYAGLAPGYVGLYQLNIAVPQNASTGDRVPLTITINGVPSQDNVTIAVR